MARCSFSCRRFATLGWIASRRVRSRASWRDWNCSVERCAWCVSRADRRCCNGWVNGAGIAADWMCAVDDGEGSESGANEGVESEDEDEEEAAVEEEEDEEEAWAAGAVRVARKAVKRADE